MGISSGRGDGCSEKSHFPGAAVQHFLPVSSFRGFLPKENKEESHFPRDSMHCLPRPTSLLKKSFGEQFSVRHVQRTTVPLLPWGHPTAMGTPHCLPPLQAQANSHNHCHLHSYLTGADFYKMVT